MSRRLAVVVSSGLLLAASTAAGQVGQAGPPGPFVVDLRGATSGLPTGAAYYPPTLTETVAVPARGFGGDAGVHVYPFSLAGLRVGLGAAFAYTRGTASGVTATAGDDSLTRSSAGLAIVAPQLSVNFGTRDGWSYLSGGVGVARLRTRLENANGPLSRSTGWTRSFNAGGGARWFITPRLAVGFDLRVHRLSQSRSGPPGLIVTSVAAGLSLR